jgi:hypothetical protein
MTTRPAFSEELHDRIVSAIQGRAHDAPTPVEQRPFHRGAGRWRGRMASVVAAACLLVGVMLSWQFAHRPDIESFPDSDSMASAGTDHLSLPLGITSVLPVSPFDEPVGTVAIGFGGLAVSAGVVPQSAALKHDARLATEVILRPLPVDMALLAGL